MSLVKALEWRYATKKYDASKKISPQQFADLLTSVQLAPSLFGLQPYRFFMIEDKAALRQISTAAFGQPQITTGDHIIGIAVETDVDESTVKRYIDKAAVIRGTDHSNLEAREQLVIAQIDKLSPEQRVDWAKKQAFIGPAFRGDPS